MKTLIKYLVAALVVIMASCDDTEQLIYEQPNSFTLAFNTDDELNVEIQTGAKIGINGEEYPVLSNACISMYDVPVANQYLIYYPANAQLSDNNLDYSLPTVQTYTQGAVDQSACPLYCLTDNDGLNNMQMNVACGGLKLFVPANEDFASLTSVTFESKNDILTGDISLDATTGQVTFRENTSKTLVLKGDINISEGQGLYLALPPMVLSSALDITFVSPKGIGTCSVDLNGKSIERGKILSVALENIEWVSVTNYYGKANSIIVAPGTTSVTVDCTPYYTTSLNYTYENHAYDDSRLARSAKLLWNDVSTDFISNVSLSSDRKSFIATLNGQPGNAVIAIYDTEDPDAEDAAILWSYHIWVTDVTDQPFGMNSKGNNYTVMDRNLGAVSATPGDVGAIGLLYQWGRKDPFVTTNEVGKNTEAIMYNQVGTVSLKIESGGEEKGTVAYSVKNPATYIKYSRSKSNVATPPYYYSYDWLYWGDNALWGNPEGYNYPSAATIQKSVYDPCPEGYMVAPRDTWLNNSSSASGIEASVFLSTSNWDTEKLGYSLNYNGQGLWYPLGGLRNRKTGKLQDAEKSGYYWQSTAFASNGADASYMNVGKDKVDTAGKNSRANAFSVRCVRIN